MFNYISVTGKNNLPVLIKYEREVTILGQKVYLMKDLGITAAVVKDHFRGRVILFDIEKYKRSSKAEKTFIMLHELGHIELNHNFGKRSVKQEKEADLYAVCAMLKRGYSDIEVINTFASVVNKHMSKNGIAGKEATIRYEQINKALFNL